jgi:hypothetical protein
MLDKPMPLDCRSVNRRAVALWPAIRDHIVGLRGYPLADVIRLNEANVLPEAGRARKPGCPQLKELRGPSPYEVDGGPGAWNDLGTGQGGPDLVSMIEYLSGGADRRVCADFLSRLCDRIVKVEAA